MTELLEDSWISTSKYVDATVRVLTALIQADTLTTGEVPLDERLGHLTEAANLAVKHIEILRLKDSFDRKRRWAELNDD